MFSDLQLLRNHLATSGAQLGGIPGVNSNDLTTSFYRFVRGELYELTPGHICDTPVDRVVPMGLQALDVQILEGDELIRVDQLPTFLVCEILAPVGLPLIGVLQGMHRLLPFGTAQREFFLLALQAGDVFCIRFHPALALDFGAIRKDRKRRQPQVDPNHLVVSWKWFFFHFTGETGIPIAKRVTPEGQGFDCSPNGSVLDQTQRANFGKKQTVIEKSKPRLFEGETVVAPVAFEARKPGGCPGFDPAEEGFEGQVHTLLGILQHLRMHLHQFWFALLPGSQQLMGIIQRERFMFLLPGVLASGQGFVVHPTAYFQRFLKQSTLASRGIKAKLKGLLHRTIVLGICFHGNYERCG